MSQQPNSDIKLSWAAEGEERGRCLLLTLSPSPDLHSSQPFKKSPFKNRLSATTAASFHAHTFEAHVRLHFQSSDLRLNYIWSVLARYNGGRVALP